MADKKNGAGRTRNFATVVYPESAPDDWFDVLTELRIPAFISPLHDMDVNPTGEVKKEHFHVIIMFDSVKTTEQAIEVFQKIGGVGCERVNSIRGYARYLCHMDNPEKAQYRAEDVRSLCGADFIGTISLPSDDLNAIREMMDFINRNTIYAYCDLLDFTSNYRDDWFRVLCHSGTYVIKEYLKTKYWADHQLLDEERFVFKNE